MTIRKARQGDIGAVVELWKELMDFHKALDPVFARSRGGHKAFAEYLRKEYIGGDRRRAWVAQAGREIVGLCMAVIEDNAPVLVLKQHGRIEGLVVTKKWRGKGIGEKLLRRARRWFREKGMSRVEVHHSAANDLAAAFYVRMGFRPYLKTLFLELPEGKVK
ncbi:MAG: GNAT family N-acetyltransferase [Planctomycetota bacterium]